MTRHLVRLLWNRRRHNALLVVEILCSFLVLFGVVLLGAQYANNYRKPLGYDIDRAWTVAVAINAGDTGPQNAAGQIGRFRQLLAAVGDLPQVESAAAGFTTPYASASWTSGMRIGGRQIDYGVNQVTDAFPAIMDVRLLSGRWFSREDDGAAWRPVVLNARLARDIFGNTDVVGRTIRRDREPYMDRLTPEEQAEQLREMRVVGVIEEFRQLGELSTPESYMFERIDLSNPETAPPRAIVLKLREGVTAAFEEALVKRMQAAAPDWSFDVTPLSQLRTEMLQAYLTPLLAVAIVALFLLFMVALGLTGVVWQNVTERTREIGVRRAKGATRAGVYRQFLTELAILTTMALVVGVVLVVQLPLVVPDQMHVVPRPVFIVSVLLSMAAILALTLGAGWYPSRLATTIEPAEALRYE
jgi:putative ABC transport system permease protein